MNDQPNRDLFLALVKVNIRSPYQKSFLGVVWVLLLPIIASSVWLLYHQSGMFKPTVADQHYVPFLLSGLACWSMFHLPYRFVSDTIQRDGRMMLQTGMSASLSASVQLASGLSLSLIGAVISWSIALILLGEFHAYQLGWLLAMLPLVGLGAVIGLLAAPLRILAPDFKILIDFAVLGLMFITPVLFDTQVVSGTLLALVELNPLTPLVELPRNLMIGADITLSPRYMVVTASLVAVAPMALYYYRRTAPMTLERLKI